MPNIQKKLSNLRAKNYLLITSSNTFFLVSARNKFYSHNCFSSSVLNFCLLRLLCIRRMFCITLSAATLFTILFIKSPKYERWFNRHDDFNDKREALKTAFAESYKESDKPHEEFIKGKLHFDELLKEPECAKKTPWLKVFFTPLIL